MKQGSEQAKLCTVWVWSVGNQPRVCAACVWVVDKLVVHSTPLVDLGAPPEPTARRRPHPSFQVDVDADACGRSTHDDLGADAIDDAVGSYLSFAACDAQRAQPNVRVPREEPEQQIGSYRRRYVARRVRCQDDAGRAEICLFRVGHTVSRLARSFTDDVGAVEQLREAIVEHAETLAFGRDQQRHALRFAQTFER